MNKHIKKYHLGIPIFIFKLSDVELASFSNILSKKKVFLLAYYFQYQLIYMTMYQKLFLLILVNGLLFELGFSQASLDNKCRTIDGTFNNLSNPSWGATGTNLVRLGKAAYQDGIFQPFTGKISGRVVSNEIFAQDEIDIKDPSNLSDFCWVFGQFIDHEFGLTPNNTERFDISVPPGDIWFDPNDKGNAVIQMKRNLFDKNSGNSISNPRQHVNMVTSFIDGSGVYGSDIKRANWLRAFKNGKLKVSDGNLLPYNTSNGEFNSPIDPLAPEMGNDTGEESKLFVAGDVRANENPLLASVHTLFVREHNRQCDLIKLKNPAWTDEEVYQYARKIVGGFIQQIFFYEWLPSVGVQLPAYSGYKTNVNPTVSNEFTGAGSRVGHTLLSSKIKRLNPDGTPFQSALDLRLRDVFFKVSAIKESGGIEPFLQGMGSQVQQRFDSKIVDDIRNFLFGKPGQGGFDMAAINIQRGRERGLPSINQLRKALQLSPYNAITDINPDNVTLTRKLESLFRDMESIDLWVALLSERKLEGSIFGESMKHFLSFTFTNLRDGDRFYYEVDPVLSTEDKNLIRGVKFSHLVLANTAIKKMQSLVFTQVNYPDVCGKMDMEASFSFRNLNEVPISNMGVYFSNQVIRSTNALGEFSVKNLSACKAYEFVLATDVANPLAGLSTKDILLIQNHILGNNRLKSIPSLVAADVDNSGGVSSLDIIALRKIILGYTSNFDVENSWQYVSSLASDMGVFPNKVKFLESNPYGTRQDFYLVKKGDVDGNWYNEAPSESVAASMVISENDFIAGQEVNYPMQFSEGGRWAGFQFSLAIQSDLVELEDIQRSNLPDFFEANLNWNKKGNVVHVSWNYSGINVPFFEKNQLLFTLKLKAKKQGFFSEAVTFAKDGLSPEIYQPDATSGKINRTVLPNQINDFITYSPYPNPFVEETNIPYTLDASTFGVLNVFDLTGKLVLRERRLMASGKGNWLISSGRLSHSGLYLYNIVTDSGHKSAGKIWLLQK